MIKINKQCLKKLFFYLLFIHIVIVLEYIKFIRIIFNILTLSPLEGKINEQFLLENASNSINEFL